MAIGEARGESGSKARTGRKREVSLNGWSQRLGLASASLGALAIAPQRAEAAVVKVTGSPVSLSGFASNGSFANWSVDSSGGYAFQLRQSGNIFYPGSSTISGGTTGGFSYAANMIFGPLGGKGIGFAYDPIVYGVAGLAPGQNVGPSLGSGLSWAFGTVALTYYNGLSQPNFQSGDNYFGFRFNQTSGPQYQYGYAVLNWDPTSATVTITQWAYETQPNTALTVQSFDAVPAPLGLAGLAAGAAWTRRLRRRIRESAEAA